jgi:hypothetical protein
MNGVTYFRGIVATGYNDKSVTYDIAGKGFTRLTGTFGRTSNNGGTRTITGDGKFLGGYEVSATGTAVFVDVAIPAGTEQIVIRFNARNLGLGDALFSR